MKISFTLGIVTFFTMIFLCLAVIIVIAYTNGRRFRETSLMVEHTNSVLHEAELTLSLAKDLNGGGRGYVNTGDSSYLEYFNIAQKTIFNHITRLRELADDGPEQRAKIDSITTLIYKRLGLSFLIIKYKNENRIKEATDLLNSRISRNYMNQIRSMLTEIKEEENMQLEYRKKIHEESVSVASITFILLCTTSIILLMISFFVIKYHFERREKAEAQTRESASMFSTLFYKSPVMKVIAEVKTGKMIALNDEFAGFWEYTKEEMIGKKAADLSMVVTEREQIRAILQKNTLVRDLETKTVSRTGQSRWVSSSIDRINLNGVDCYLIAALDITKRKEAEESLAKLNGELEQRVEERTKLVIESEKKYRHIFENNPMPIWVIDLSTFKFLDVNMAAIAHYGFSRNEFLSMNALDIRPAEEKQRFHDFPRPLNLEAANYNRGIWKHIKKDGSVIQAEVFAHEIFFEGQVARLVLSNDITKKIKAEEELKNIFERITDAFIALDKNWNYTYINQRAAKMHDRLPEELIGKNIWKEFPDVVGESFYMALHHAMKDQQPRHLELYYSKTGMWYEDFIYPSREGVSVYYRDITEKKTAEEKLKASHKQLRQLASHLQRIREDERVRIAREIHDELGQQLTGLKMDVAWLDKKLTDVNPGIKEKFSSMLSLLDETVKTVRRISTELRPGILDDLGLKAALEWQSSEFEKRSGIGCKFTSGFSDGSIDKTTATSIFRIYQEALTNIARHSGATEVESDFSTTDHTIELRISDNGKGFNTEETKSKMTLGILGMKERALVMHGELILTSEPGKGTTIRVKIPMHSLGTIEQA